MVGKRKQRFKAIKCNNSEYYGVWDLMFQNWYEPQGKKITGKLIEIETVCSNLQRLFEYANPFPFLDENESGPLFMDPDHFLRN